MHFVVGSKIRPSSSAMLMLAKLACLVLGLSVNLAMASPNPKANPADPDKVLKVAFPVPETGFDPVRVNDLYSNTITAVIFQPLLTYDWMAMPTRIVPNAAESMPVVSADQTTFTFKVKKVCISRPTMPLRDKDESSLHRILFIPCCVMPTPKIAAPKFQILMTRSLVSQMLVRRR